MAGDNQNSVVQIRPLHYRAIFISDVHLGFPGCSAAFLLDFLRSTTCDYLYLVGDIIDIWQMKKKIYWPQAHNDVVRTILGKAKHGTKIVYVPGNHDELLRDFDMIRLGNVSIMDACIHVTNDGKRLLVTHGDQFDGVVRCSKLAAIVGTRIYEWLLKANILVNYVRRKFGLAYWSLAGVLKHKVKRAVNFISNFEAVLTFEARKQKVDGVVSGHIHHAEIRMIDDIIYCNCGDWLESCTALVETNDGRLEILHWTEQMESIKTFPLEVA